MKKRYTYFLGIIVVVGVLLAVLPTLRLPYGSPFYSLDASKYHIEQLKDDSTEDFIASISPTASQIAKDADLYASVMIAQAVLESNSGQSKLSQAPYYNFFGIKGNYNKELGRTMAREILSFKTLNFAPIKRQVIHWLIMLSCSKRISIKMSANPIPTLTEMRLRL